MEIGTIIGLILGAFFVVLGMLMGANFNVGSAVSAFIDYPSIMVVLGGTLSGVLVSYPLPQFLGALKAVKNIFKPPKIDPEIAIKNIIDLANFARREGILALEERVNSMNDKFLKKGIMLIVDGTDPELVRGILETEMTYIENRHKNIKGVWEFLASSAPAWGMLGTFIGLVLMLRDMSDPDQLGPKMSVAIITSFYGALIANYLFTPISNKLKYFNAEEMILKEILIEGILSIQAGENPRIIEEKLKSFLSPVLRNNISDDKESDGR